MNTNEIRNAQRSIRNTIDAAEGWRLVSRTAGLWPSGSTSILVAEAWGVITQNDDGATFGQWFAPTAAGEAEARKHFADRVAAVIADREEAAKHRPAVLRARIESDVESLTTLHKYGRYGKRDKLIGADAKKERGLRDRIAENQNELANIQAAAVEDAAADGSDD